MIGLLRGLVLRMLVVPPKPEAPEGSPGSVMVFHPGRNFYRLQVLQWLLVQAGVVGFLGAAGLAVARKAPHEVWMWLRAAGLVFIAVEALVTYLALWLRYEMCWYIVTDRSLRIREGVWILSEITMTYSNIQEMTLNADPLQKVLGLTDLQVKSAGGTANFTGLDNGDEVRNLIEARVKAYRDSGLGEASRTAADDPLLAAREVLTECRALRAVIG